MGIATADLNHDGNLDLIYTDGSTTAPTLHILLGRGNGTFSHSQDINLPAGVCCLITIADLNGDGNPDIIVQGSQQFTVVIAVILGNGDGTFQAPMESTFQPTNLSAYPDIRSAAAGDINGDGKTDLLLSDAMNNEIDILLGNGSGGFTLFSTLRGAVGNSVYLADLNGDGHLDIVATDDIGAVFAVALGNGDGTFQPFVNYQGQPATGAFILADVDGDGHLDMVTEYYPGTLAVFKGNPDGTFSSPTIIGSVSSSDLLIGVADFNSDGLPDLLFSTPAGVGVKLNQGNLTFGPLKQSVAGFVSYASVIETYPVWGDLNNDGAMDIADPVEGGIAILLGNKDGTFASADLYDVGEPTGAVAIADFNGDSLPDIAVTLPATYPRLLLGNGQGSFSLAPDQNSSYGSQAPASNIEAVDFNGDGKKDVDFGTEGIYGSAVGSQSVELGTGSGTFSTPASPANASPVVADFTGNGRSDMLGFDGSGAVVLLGQADGSFTTATTPLRLGAPPSFAVGDVNNDGKPDLVLNYQEHLEIWLGNGDGTFRYSSSINDFVQGAGVGGQPIVVADLDGDGNADIVIGPGPGSPALTIFYGNGDGTFQPPVTLPVSHAYTQIIVADVDGDNKPDLVMTDGSIISVMTNEGSRTFNSETYYVAGKSISLMSVADVNGDGFPDIAVANPGGTTVTVLLNQPNGTSLEGAASTGTLTTSPEPSVFGQLFSASLTVSGGSSSATAPTGSVSFYVDGDFLATTPLASGTASYNVTETLIPVQHTIVATYNGDSTYAPKSFAVLHTVAPPTYPTQTTLSATPATILASQTVRLTAGVSSTPAVPAGIVTFFDGSSSLGAANIDSSGSAYLDTALLSTGTHSLTAIFQGFTEPGFTGNSTSYTAAIFAPSKSAPVTEIVSSDATTTSLSTSSASPTAGTVVTFTADVSSTVGAPFGSATFYDGSSPLGTMALKADGSATFSTASLTTGSHNITAAFTANGPYAESSSSGITISVSAPPAGASSTVVSVIPEPNSTGNSTLVANVGALEGSPVGVVTFLDNGLILGTATTDASGFARLQLASLGSGIHRLTASFVGGQGFAPSVSPEIRDQWPASGPGFTLRFEAHSLTVVSGESKSLLIQIIPSSNFAEPINFSCPQGLPSRYYCAFSPSPVIGGGFTNVTIRRSTGRVEFGQEAWAWAGLALLLALLSPSGTVARRRFSFVTMVVFLASLPVLTGCGGLPPRHWQPFVVTIRAASGAGSSRIVHSGQVILRVASHGAAR